MEKFGITSRSNNSEVQHYTAILDQLGRKDERKKKRKKELNFLLTSMFNLVRLSGSMDFDGKFVEASRTQLQTWRLMACS